MNLSLTVSNLRSGHSFQLKITKGHNSFKNVIQFMVLILYTSSDHPLYLYQVLSGHKNVHRGIIV